MDASGTGPLVDFNKAQGEASSKKFDFNFNNKANSKTRTPSPSTAEVEDTLSKLDDLEEGQDDAFKGEQDNPPSLMIDCSTQSTINIRISPPQKRSRSAPLSRHLSRQPRTMPVAAYLRSYWAAKVAIVIMTMACTADSIVLPTSTIHPLNEGHHLLYSERPHYYEEQDQEHRHHRMAQQSCAWTQVGADIDGADYDTLGSSVALSADGFTIAIAAPELESFDDDVGYVVVYTYDPETGGLTRQRGSPIVGASNSQSATFVDLSHDGQTLVIGNAKCCASDTTELPFGIGIVRVFIFDVSANEWVQRGQTITGEAEDDNSGMSVSLNGVGTAVAIGANYNDGIRGIDSGHVRVYHYVGGSWALIGPDIDGEAAFDNFGWVVSLASDEMILAVGAPSNSGNGSSAGHVRVYRFEGSLWSQIGSDINGEVDGEGFGTSVALSATGTALAIGAPGGGASNQGRVVVYQWTSEAVWDQVGDAIEGAFSEDMAGSSLALSEDGTVLALGAPSNFGSGSNGRARVFLLSGQKQWVQIGQDLVGEAAGDHFGSSISLSADGTALAVGAKENETRVPDFGRLSSGHVRVFSIGHSCIVESRRPTPLPTTQPTYLPTPHPMTRPPTPAPTGGPMPVTLMPLVTPTKDPTKQPTRQPITPILTASPTRAAQPATLIPSPIPTNAPVREPSKQPIPADPTLSPTMREAPSSQPTVWLSKQPIFNPDPTSSPARDATISQPTTNSAPPTLRPTSLLAVNTTNVDKGSGDSVSAAWLAGGIAGGAFVVLIAVAVGGLLMSMHSKQQSTANTQDSPEVVAVEVEVVPPQPPVPVQVIPADVHKVDFKDQCRPAV